MTVAIVVPSHGNVPAKFSYDLAQMMGFLGANYVGPDLPIQAVSLSFLTCTYIHAARQELAELALAQGVDYVLWLDSDMRFPKNILPRLMVHRKDIVGINYSKRGVPPDFVAIKSIDPPERLVTNESTTGLEEVEGIGFGAVLMRASALRKVMEAHRPAFWYDYKPELDQMYGEDIYFALRAREEGIQVFVDHDMSKECAHIGQFEYRVEHVGAVMESDAEVENGV